MMGLKKWFLDMLCKLGTAAMLDRVMIAGLGIMGAVLLIVAPGFVLIVTVGSALVVWLAVVVFPALGVWADSQTKSESAIDEGKKVS